MLKKTHSRTCLHLEVSCQQDRQTDVSCITVLKGENALQGYGLFSMQYRKWPLGKIGSKAKRLSHIKVHNTFMRHTQNIYTYTQTLPYSHTHTEHIFSPSLAATSKSRASIMSFFNQTDRKRKQKINK